MSDPVAAIILPVAEIVVNDEMTLPLIVPLVVDMFPFVLDMFPDEVIDPLCC